MDTNKKISLNFYQKAKEEAVARQGTTEFLVVMLACLILALLVIIYIPSMPIYFAFFPFVASFSLGIRAHHGKSILPVSGISIIRQMKTLVESEILSVINAKQRINSSAGYLKELEQIHQDLSGYS